jgi:hypothetical protein
LHPGPAVYNNAEISIKEARNTPVVSKETKLKTLVFIDSLQHQAPAVNIKL